MRTRLWAAAFILALVGAFVLDLSLSPGYVGAIVCAGIVIVAVAAWQAAAANAR